MFKTLKSRIIFTSFVMLTLLMSVFIFFAIQSRMFTKQLMVQNYGYSIDAAFVDNINDSIMTLEDNLKSLALIGGLHYRTSRSDELTDEVVIRIFRNYPNTLGGGIWFKPYIFGDNKKYNCFYAYRNKDNKVVLDKNFASAEYDYPNQQWYKEIISKVTPKRNIVWSKPYYEKIGSTTKMVTAGTGIYANGKLVGIATVDWEISSVIDNISKMKPHTMTFSMYKKGKKIKNSFVLLGHADDDYIIATNDPYLDGDSLVGHSLKEIPWYASDLYWKTYITYHGKKYIPFWRKLRNGMVLVICLPKTEMFINVNMFYFPFTALILLFIFMIFVRVYFGINRYIINPIDKLINIAHKISDGKDINIKIDKPAEFAQLASTFDTMTKDLKTITKEKEHINSELNIAKSIQASSLPDVFPPFPDRDEFDIYAFMEPAKEVGGDFYDFYFIDENRLMFLIADVSGKGIPASLFMMTVKTLINNLSQIGYEPSKLINLINKKICENNKQGFFVTMFSGIVDVKTGEMTYVNCGHNPPLIKSNSQEYKYLESESNIVLGAFDNFDYKIHKLQLHEGDTLCLYTDGVTEALNSDGQMYGEERLLEKINELDNNDIKSMALGIKNDVLIYSKNVERSDDLTLLIFKYGKSVKNSHNAIYKAPASKEHYKEFYQWLHQICKDWYVSDELTNKIDMCGEEIYANIAFYAYEQSEGEINVTIQKEKNEIILRFEDSGIPYNPLEKPDPDITLPPEQRPLGGLGIFMVKEMADNISYEYKDQNNILTLRFNIK